MTSPKSTAGVRDVAIPPHLLDVLEHHLATHMGSAPDALVFPSEDGRRHLAPRHRFSAIGIGLAVLLAEMS